MFYNNIIAAWVLIAASVSSAQMVKFDVSILMSPSFPDADIATPGEFVTYESSVQSPGLLALRCTDQYATCTSVTSPDNSYFTSGATVSGDYSYAEDFQDCSHVNGICYMSCDPRCECQETNAAGETLPCKEGTPPTSSPTVAPATETAASPAPTAASAAASTTHVRSTMAILGSMVAIILW
ncbi:expressed unknown protein [Seminavis robusta]|uniref:Uncharacterized protein n=1 Tax=Seminavis robusta TaxID=568900 RepID=A0A9N8F097_9STRA|nr:expressed unknown protein [Seminavis robusta]|eukprot:Sro2121_g315430.1 n/a (182) ;mRNA; f:1941-2819